MPPQLSAFPPSRSIQDERGQEQSDKKSPGKTGRPARHRNEREVEAMGRFLNRWDRYGRQAGHDGGKLSPFARALAMWRELTQADVPPPVLTRISAYQRARLEEAFALAEEELCEEFGRSPRLSELASYVASWYPVRDPVYATAMRQLERLIDEAMARAYWSGVPALYGLERCPLRADAEAFWRWYRETA